LNPEHLCTGEIDTEARRIIERVDPYVVKEMIFISTAPKKNSPSIPSNENNSAILEISGTDIENNMPF
jgi:hypothetical protein